MKGDIVPLLDCGFDLDDADNIAEGVVVEVSYKVIGRAGQTFFATDMVCDARALADMIRKGLEATNA